MKIEKKTTNGIHQTFLLADDGMIITNGTDVYGSDIRLAEGVNEKDFYEITEAEYKEILHKQEEEINI